MLTENQCCVCLCVFVDQLHQQHFINLGQIPIDKVNTISVVFLVMEDTNHANANKYCTRKA